MKIVLLEDDQAQAELLLGWLTAENFTVTHHKNCATLLANIDRDLPDLFILDPRKPNKIILCYQTQTFFLFAHV